MLAPFCKYSEIFCEAGWQRCKGQVHFATVYCCFCFCMLQEHHQGNHSLVIEDNVEMNNVVYMFNCHDSTLTVKGKLNSLFLDSCRKSSVVFDSLVSSVEFVNCQSVQMQVCVMQSYFTLLHDNPECFFTFIHL